MALKVALYFGFMVFLAEGIVLKSGSVVLIGFGVVISALAIFAIHNAYKLINPD